MHARVGPAQQQQRLAVAAQAAGDVAQLGHPRAVVGALCEVRDAVQQGLLAVDPVLQPAGEVGHGAASSPRARRSPVPPSAG